MCLEPTSQERVRFTIKALRELAALAMGLDEKDACHVLANLAASDFGERLVSKKTASGCMWSSLESVESSCT